MIIKEVEILPINKKNNLGRIYDKEAADRIIEEFYKRKENLGNFYGCLDHSSKDYSEYGYPELISIKNIAFIAEDIKIVKNRSLFCKIEILETPMGKELKEMIKNVVFRPSVWGFLENEKVKVERLISINAFSKDLDTFTEISDR